MNRRPESGAPAFLSASLAERMRAGVALGSNIEPRLGYLQEALRRLFSLHCGSQPVLCSKVYETSPVDCKPGSPPFLNAALELSTDLSPQQLLLKFKGIESDLGRLPTSTRNSPRSIDIDLLYCDSVVLSEPNLTIPHPQIAKRRFVLQPLADIRPDLVLPNFTSNIQQLLAELQNDESVKEYLENNL
jgi:2-amino-4-hydroxy-6-hydroxymethyldihydropteridine diphosphokinase